MSTMLGPEPKGPEKPKQETGADRLAQGYRISEEEILDDDSSFAVPALLIAAILIIGGYFVVTYKSDRVGPKPTKSSSVTISVSVERA